MAKTSFVGSELQTSVDTFGSLIGQVNNLIFEAGASFVTTSLDASGDTTKGNAFVDGVFSAKDFVAQTRLRGGTMTTIGTLTISSDTTILAVDSIGSNPVTFTVGAASIFNGVSTFNNDTIITGAGALFDVQSSVPTATLSAATTLIDSVNFTVDTDTFIFDASVAATVTGARWDMDALILDVSSVATFTGDVTYSGAGKTTTLGQDANIINGLTLVVGSSTSTAINSPILIAENTTSQTFTSALFDVTIDDLLLTSSETVPFDVLNIAKFDGTNTDVTFKASRVMTVDGTTLNSNFTNSTITGTGTYSFTAPIAGFDSDALTLSGAVLTVASLDVNVTGTTFDVSGVSTFTGNTNLNGATNAIAGTTLNISAATNFTGTSLDGVAGLTTIFLGNSTLGSAGKIVTLAGSVASLNSTATNVSGTLTVTGATTLNSDVTIANDKKLRVATSSLTASVMDFVDVSSTTYSVGFPASGTFRISANAAANKTFKLENLGSGKFNMDVDGNGVFGGTLAVTGTSTFTGLITGNITTANAWATARTLTVTGALSGTSAAFDGSGNITLDVTLGTHEHAGADITSGTVGFAFLPTGTGATQVSIGDHKHSGNDITSGTVGFTRLPVGVGSSQVAIGDHVHADLILAVGGSLTGTLTFANTTGISLRDFDAGVKTALFTDASDKINVGNTLNALLLKGTSIVFNDGVSDRTVIHSNNVNTEVNHNTISGVSADTHVDHTTVSVIAGNGLTGGGTIAASRTLTVGAGDGIVVNAGNVAVDYGAGGSALTVSRSDHTHAFDNYGSWSFTTDTVGNITVTSGDLVSYLGGSFMDVTHVDDVITITHADTSSVSSLTALTGANVVSDLNFDGAGHVTSIATRTMTLTDIGAAASGHNHDGTYVKLTGGETITGLVTIGSGGTTFLGLNVATTSGIGGDSIRANGDIIAFFSDPRLKEYVMPIMGALDKVNQISGVTYQHNQLAVDCGLIAPELRFKRYVGVLADEIERVLPEAVTLAPFDIDEEAELQGVLQSKSGENYKTVKYDKLTALLIEAVKELSRDNDILKQRLDQAGI